MSSTLSRPVLVLNKHWTPIGTVTLQRAITMLWSEYSDGTPKAKIIEPESFQQMTWDDWSKLKPIATDDVIKAANISFRIPEVIQLARYEKLPAPKVHFSRRTLYKRDSYTCQYCGKQPGSEELTVEHIQPKSRGGLTTWENCVAACVECNHRKGSKTLAESGLTLRSKPCKPKVSFFRSEITKPIKSWENFISEIYWSAELENQNKD
jgi:5-methylcytosine-specific restriction endonuclease McrA